MRLYNYIDLSWKKEINKDKNKNKDIYFLNNIDKSESGNNKDRNQENLLINRNKGEININELNKELIEEENAKSSIKTQLFSKDEYIKQNMGNNNNNIISNETNINQKKLIDMLLLEKKQLEEKIKDIKKLTTKGVDPEIENLICKHKTVLAKLEEEYLVLL